MASPLYMRHPQHGMHAFETEAAIIEGRKNGWQECEAPSTVEKQQPLDVIGDAEKLAIEIPIKRRPGRPRNDPQ